MVSMFRALYFLVNSKRQYITKKMNGMLTLVYSLHVVLKVFGISKHTGAVAQFWSEKFLFYKKPLANSNIRISAAKSKEIVK